MPRILILALAAVLVVSLIVSNDINYGHADVRIAPTADEVQPLATGDVAPRFIVETAAGDPFDFDPRELERPALLLVFRGGWCPYCNTYLSDMRHVIPEIRDLDIDVLFLSGDRSELLYKSLREQTQADIDGLGYTILSDADAQAAVALGIAFQAARGTIDRRQQKGDDIEGSSMLRHGVLPVPAVFAVDRSGTIAFSYINPDYAVRLPADELLAVARTIAAD